MRTALWQSHPDRVLARADAAGEADGKRVRQRLEALLERVERLTASARLIEAVLDTVFVLCVATWLQDVAGSWPLRLLASLVVAAPLLVLADFTVPQALAARFGDDLLVRGLSAFGYAQLPVQPLAAVFEGLRRALLRVFRAPERHVVARQIVEGLRDVIAETALSGDLGETEREIIENVMEFRDVDVAATMTPRTEIYACDVEDGVEGALRILADCGHSRVPVYEENLDRIIGTVSARDLVQAMADGAMETADLHDLARPATFVPETKRVSELFVEFRRNKNKYAVVLDEYGGTAGLVTMGDILEELVGELRDEFDAAEPVPVRHVDEHTAEIDAHVHVSEVNEALELELPEEEDYETLGGFVLAELGHFPTQGESFERDDVHFSVLEANDRRVLRVRVRKLAPEKA